MEAMSDCIESAWDDYGVIFGFSSRKDGIIRDLDLARYHRGMRYSV